MTSQKLIEDPCECHTHVVLLGAGASRAAFPEGDKNGRHVPIMNDLVDILGLQPLIDESGFDVKQERNFEVIYSNLVLESRYAPLVQEIGQRINQYFSCLLLPDQATIYDRLLLSLRSKDAVFTFNWDPFLFDAYQRNREVVSLPEIFFLHGNVRIGACSNPDHHDDECRARGQQCSKCSRFLDDVPLLYPIKQKKYSDAPYIQRSWEAAKQIFKEAFTLTIFGYGAPESDEEAVKLLELAWFDDGGRSREFEHVEIVDIADSSCLHKRWSQFTPTHHYQYWPEFNRSRIMHWPRRSCESVLASMRWGMPCEDFPLPDTDSLAKLQKFVADMAKHEQSL